MVMWVYLDYMYAIIESANTDALSSQSLLFGYPEAEIMALIALFSTCTTLSARSTLYS